MSEMTQTVTGATQPQSMMQAASPPAIYAACSGAPLRYRLLELRAPAAYGLCLRNVASLKRIYQDPTELGRALQRHLVLFNTTPHLSTFIFGLSIAMEEENQRNPEFNEESINAIKTSLMGPLAGIGDSIFWGSLKVIAAGMGIYFAQQGSLLGPILALLVYNLPHLLCRWYG